MPRPRIRSAPDTVRKTSILGGKYTIRASDRRFRRLFHEAVARPPDDIPRIRTVRSVVFSKSRTKTMVGLTIYSHVTFMLVFSRPRQTITFYSSLFHALSDRAAVAVIAHELAHAWLNEHVRPEESARREKEADDLARVWGFGPELATLDQEAETVPYAQ